MKNIKKYMELYHKLTESVDQSTSDEWIILSFKGSGGIVNVDPASVNRYLGNKLFTIYSVKRLPDGEIFTLGDKVGIGTLPAGNITRLWVSFDQMRLDVGSLGLVLRDFIKKF